MTKKDKNMKKESAKNSASTSIVAAKKNLAKKIASISIIAVVVALVITTVVLALVPKTMSNPIMDGYATITIYQGNKSAQYKRSSTATTDAQREHNEVFEMINELHEKSLEDNLLSSMFQGTKDFKMNVVKASVANVITSVAETSGNAIVYTYLGDEKLTLKLDGEVYEDESSTGAVVKFDMIVMPLNTGDSFEECKIYLADRSTKKSAYQVTFLAHQAELNKYVSELTLY